MDELKLAQFLCRNASDKKLSEILNDIDVNCTISSEPSGFKDKLSYLGYNCLHMAVMSSNLGLTQKLINLGANLLQQGMQDGKTPLRKALECSVQSFWVRIGVLKEQPLINMLLSAQVESNNTLNAKCNDGISHLHIACMFNHTEAVHFLAKSGESLNQAINADADILPGFTPLHCAIRYSSAEAATILLTLGADIYQENAGGISPINYLMERLLEVNDDLTMNNGLRSLPYEKEIDRLESILKVIALKYKTNDSNLVKKTGLSAFHLACALKPNWIVQSYITRDFKGINMPVTCISKIWSGWTPLHFAACCNLKTFGLLLKNRADFKIKNAKGETALDLCLRRYSPEVVFSYLPEGISIILSDKSTKLSNVILALSEYDTCQQFMNRLTDDNVSVPPESPFWPGYNLLHMSVSMNHKTKFSKTGNSKKYYTNEIDYSVDLPSSWTSETKSIYWEILDMNFRTHCNIYEKNADGLTPIHLAFKLHEWHVVQQLLGQVEHNVVGPDNLSFLHMACATGKKDVIKLLLMRGADVNSPLLNSTEWHENPIAQDEIYDLHKVVIRKNSTPLHIAVMFKMENVIETLLEKNPDIHAEDELGFTPIHLSFTSTKTIARLLISANVSSLRDVKREDGLSHLHVAAFADNEKAVKKLIQDGADINLTYLGNTPLHMAMEGEKAAHVLINMGANIFAENLHYETPFDIAMKNSCSKASMFLFKKLKKKELQISKTMKSGLTPLHIACFTSDIDWAKNLLENGANSNAKMTNSDGQTNTPMHLLIADAQRTQTNNLVTFIKLLLAHGADVTVANNDSTTPLHMIANACLKTIHHWQKKDRANLLTVADLMLSSQRSFKINPTNANGFSHFHFACAINNLAIIEKYLNNGIDVNLSTSPFANKNAGFTSLHFACLHENLETIQLLVERGADVKASDAYGNTPLHLLVQQSILYEQLIDMFLMEGADINAKNLRNDTPIRTFLQHNHITNEQFCFFIRKGSLIHIEDEINGGQGIIGYILGRTKSSDIEFVFETLINFYNVKEAISQGFLATHSAVCVREGSNLTREHYMKVIQRLIHMGSDIEEQDDEGKRPLEKALNFRNLAAIQALLLFGANVNFIEMDNYSFITSLYHCGLDQAIRTVVTKHLKKMIMVKLDLSVSNQKVAIDKMHDNKLQRYQFELEQLKNHRIYQSLTARHFLSEWGIVMEYLNLPIVKRQAIDHFFKQTDNLHKEFPKFAGLLMMQYRKAVARVNLMQPAKNILVEAGIDLPDLCLEAILKYFKNCELEFWIEKADEMSRPLKRQRIQ